ncbi:hypothetical protein NL676_039016 [Syzygium grande]|nr:hypothetical protein NL676_039016 [Syzygium grande]
MSKETSSFAPTLSSTASNNPTLMSPPSIGEKLTGTNFPIWKTQISPYLCAARLLSILDGTEPQPEETVKEIAPGGAVTQMTNPAFENWKFRESIALAWILNSSTAPIVAQLTSHTSAASVWKSLTKDQLHALILNHEGRLELASVTNNQPPPRLFRPAKDRLLLGRPVTVPTTTMQILINLGIFLEYPMAVAHIMELEIAGDAATEEAHFVSFVASKAIGPIHVIVLLDQFSPHKPT